MPKTLRGHHNCYNCGEYITWEAVIEKTAGQAYVEQGEPATAVAVGRNAIGTEYEIECTCPKCKIKNRFRYR